MSKAIQWSALTQAERNQLISEKVMGQNLLCSGKLTYGATDALCQQRVYVCMTCNALVTTHQEQSALPELHVRSVANYSQSLDTAMLAVRKMNEPHDGKFDRYARFIAELEKIVGSDMFFDLFYCDPASDDQHLTAERLCIAALRAVGVEVTL